MEKILFIARNIFLPAIFCFAFYFISFSQEQEPQCTEYYVSCGQNEGCSRLHYYIDDSLETFYCTTLHGYIFCKMDTVGGVEFLRVSFVSDTFEIDSYGLFYVGNFRLPDMKTWEVFAKLLWCVSVVDDPGGCSYRSFLASTAMQKGSASQQAYDYFRFAKSVIYKVLPPCCLRDAFSYFNVWKQ